METQTAALWDRQDRHQGDRLRLFTALATDVGARSVLYPGSFVDVAPSFVFDDVTYVDTDDRAARFFDDRAGVDEIIARHRSRQHEATWRFIHADYTSDLPIAAGSCDLLVSLYAGFVSEACTRYLRLGGLLLVNPSHGDVAMASLDDRYELAAVVTARRGSYRVSNDGLDRYLVPIRDEPVTRQALRSSGRGVAYTKSAFAYLFRLESQPDAR